MKCPGCTIMEKVLERYRGIGVEIVNFSPSASTRIEVLNFFCDMRQRIYKLKEFESEGDK